MRSPLGSVSGPEQLPVLVQAGPYPLITAQFSQFRFALRRDGGALLSSRYSTRISPQLLTPPPLGQRGVDLLRRAIAVQSGKRERDLVHQRQPAPLEELATPSSRVSSRIAAVNAKDRQPGEDR